MSFSHLCIATAMCDDCIDASQPVRTGRESNLRIRLQRAVYLPATLSALYVFCMYRFCVADIEPFTTLSKNVRDKTAVAAKLAKRTCLGDMSATFWRHMQLRRAEPGPGSGSCCGSAKTDKKASALSGDLQRRRRRGGCRFLCRSACDGVVGKGLYGSGIGREAAE